MVRRLFGTRLTMQPRVTTDPIEFGASLPARGALIALDVSPRRMGVAATDWERRLVTPLCTFLRRGSKSDLARLARLIQERQAVGLIVGLPLSMDGREGPPAEASRRFAAILARALHLPVLLQDERLTSFAVKAALEEGKLRLRKRGPRHLDHYAAAVILEDALRALAQASAQTPR